MNFRYNYTSDVKVIIVRQIGPPDANKKEVPVRIKYSEFVFYKEGSIQNISYVNWQDFWKPLNTEGKKDIIQKKFNQPS